MITLLESKLFLAKLPPMKSVMCVLQQKSSSPARCGGVAAKGRKIGTAISDPYLGFARPLSSVETLLEVENLIDEHKPGVEEAARGFQRHDLADDALGEHATRRVMEIGKARGHLEEHCPNLHRQERIC